MSIVEHEACMTEFENVAATESEVRGTVFCGDNCESQQVYAASADTEDDDEGAESEDGEVDDDAEDDEDDDDFDDDIDEELEGDDDDEGDDEAEEGDDSPDE